MTTPVPQPRQLTVIDLFSGAGGFSLAARRCGLNVLAAVEFDKDACQTYRDNIINKSINKPQLFEKDILKLEAGKFREELKLEPRALDILIGGPPCQGFSTHRINDKGIDDPRNQLLLRYFDFVKELRPKLFLVENVPGLLWKRHAAYLEKFQEIAKENGYTVMAPVRLNAKDYGVPQHRARVFILGIRNDIDASKLAWPPSPTHFAPSVEGKPTWKNASMAFEPPPADVENKLLPILGLAKVKALEYGTPVLSSDADASAVHMNHTPALIARFAETPINGSRTDTDFRLPCHSGDYPGHKDVYGRVKLGQPGPTITTGCFNPSKGRFLHPWLNHGITVRHAARLQTFPENFVFFGGMTSQGKQVGNAVPVELGAHLLEELRVFLLTHNRATPVATHPTRKSSVAETECDCLV
ncbi:MAG: hypothetical protein RL748_3986 [Pseudomonadota bacterium]|jgi:DNA (cytosine-5)-methyltransferase 1